MIPERPARRPALSVCLATYNGEPFLRAQMISILGQLGSEDEIVVVDDASSDSTVAILEGFGDRRMRIFRHPVNRGVVATFEHALQEARGELIFLCDQDDVWAENKVAAFREVFKHSAEVTLVLSNGEFIDSEGDGDGKMLHGDLQIPLGLCANLIRNHYQGALMAFRRELLGAVLPFPESIPMHDSWIGLVNAIVGRPAYLSQSLVEYRRHTGTLTTGRHGTWGRMLAGRMALILALIGRTGAMFRVRKKLRVRTQSDTAPEIVSRTVRA